MQSGRLVAQQETFETAEPRYRAMLKRPSLNRRIEGRRLLALTRDPRVFPILSKDYADPEEPQDFVRALLVNMLAEFLSADAALHTEWTRWRQGRAEADEAWLWYRSLQVEHASEPDAWRAVFTARLPMELRTVALLAAAKREPKQPLDASVLDLVGAAAATLPGRGRDRSMLLEGLVTMFEANPGKLLPEQRVVLRVLVRAMADPATSPRSRLVLARSLARALGRDNIGPDAASWLELIADASEHEIEMAYAMKRGAARPGFCGIVEHSRHIAYVIDASDSMLEPLTPRELSDMQPLTGADGGKGGGGNAAELAVDWSKVKTRFDGARELLKNALRGLTAEQQFTVILFGDAAAHLAATPKLTKVTKKNVDAACAELDAIRPGPVREQRAHGTLRGATNIHGGFLLAYRIGGKPTTAAGKKAAAPRSRIQLEEQGVDTIYLLSDGAPSIDDFCAGDTNDHGAVMDPETGAQSRHDGPVIYQGPFSWAANLVPDLERLNLFQRSAIHAIGLGEADYELLERIAKVGGGQVVRIGKQ